MKRNVSAALIFLCMAGGWRLAGESVILKVKVQRANVRAGAAATAPVIAQVNFGALLEASGREGAWFAVAIHARSGEEVVGYIHASVVEMVAQDEEEKEAGQEESPGPAADRKQPQPRATRSYAGGGLKLLGGISLGNLTLSADIPEDMKKTARTGFACGLGYESGGPLALELDLLYSPGGAVVKPADPARKERTTISGAAITLPVMVKVRLLRGRTPYVLAGAEVGYVLSRKIARTAADGSESEEDIARETKRWLYGVVFGGGFEMTVGGMSLLLEARHRLGLSSLIQDPDPGAFARPTAMTILLGIKR